MSNEEKNPDEVIEAIMDLSIFAVFVLTLISTALLLSVGTLRIIVYQDWVSLLYFAGSGLSLAFHYVVRMLMIAKN